jgi:putative DNA primase/helicase
LILAPSVVNHLGQFKNALLDAGESLPKNNRQRTLLLSRVAKSDAPEHWIYEEHVGWLKNGRAYVTINGVIGDTVSKIVGVNRSSTIYDASGRLSAAGTWTGWRNNVAELAGHSSIMVLAICIALAAPLLFFVKRRSFMINIFGTSRTGKTIATLVGASLPGIAQVEDLITWRITDTRLEQRLPEYNDAMFPIDDLDTMREKEDKEKYLRIRNIAYNLEQGWSMARDQSYTSAHGGIHEQ